MVIDEGILIALLVEKTGKSKEWVKDQLFLLKKDIGQAAKSGKPFELNGFGTFIAKDGTLFFEPAEQIQTEINQKYAGMKPIELMAAYKETGAGIPLEEPSRELPVENKPDTKKAPKKKKPEPAEEPAKDKEKEPVAAAASVDNTEPKKKGPKKSKEPRKKRTVAGDEKDPLGRILIAAVVVIAVLVGGWLVYDSGILSGFGDDRNAAAASADTTAQTSDQPPVAATEDSITNAGTNTDAVEQNGSNGVSKNEEAAPETPYGLKGEWNAEGNNGYTIVVHSFRLKSSVQQIADSLQQQGYRMQLTQISANGEQWWRLGLGQFQTVTAAQQKARNLSDPYKENHFIKRIQ